MPQTPHTLRGNIVNEVYLSDNSKLSASSSGNSNRPLNTRLRASKQGSWDSQHSHENIKTACSKRSSYELEYPQDATRDSLVENLLDSFNHFPGAEEFVSYPPSSYNYRGSSKDNSPQTPRAGWTSSMRHFRQRSQSSTEGSRSDPRPTAYHTANISMSGQSVTHSNTSPNTPRRSRELPREMSVAQDSSYETVPTSPARDSPGARRSLHREKKRSKGSFARADHQQQQQQQQQQQHESKPLASTSGASESGNQNSSIDRSPNDETINPPHPSTLTSKAGRSAVNSILSRARPVPAEYHDFSDSAPREIKCQTDAASSRMYTSDFASFTQSRTFPGNENFLPQNGSRNKLSAMLGADPSQYFQGPQASISSNSLRQVASPPTSLNPIMATASPENAFDRQCQEERKERQGFFKRVFGTGSKPIQPEKAPQLPPIIDSMKKPEKKPSQPNMTSKNAPSQYAHIPIPTEEPPEPAQSRHILQKKTSFFRRRRKTAGEKDHYPQADSSKSTNLEDSSRPSISSLRQALNPYLDHNNPNSPDDRTYYDSREYQLGDDGDNAYSFRTTASSYISSPSRQTNRSEAGSRAQNRSVASQRRDDSKRPSVAETPTSANGSKLKHLDTNMDYPTVVKRLSQSKSQPQLRVSTSKRNDDDHVVRSKEDMPRRQLPFKPGRIWLRSSSSDEKLDSTVSASTIPAKPLDPTGASALTASPVPISPADDSASTDIPLVRLQGQAGSDQIVEVTAPDMETAQKLFDDDVDPIHQGKAAILLGQPGSPGERLRRAYMNLFDFSGVNILHALRDLCGRLALKGETQQVDRILASFSLRWCECNSDHGFKSQDIVHTICYSLLLLNTDIYLADVEQKMTLKQFVRNAMPTIRSMAEGALQQDRNASARVSRASTSTFRAPFTSSEGFRSPSPSSPALGEQRPSLDLVEKGSRLSLRPPAFRTASDTSPTPYESRSTDSFALLVNAPFEGSLRAWESQVESVLKDYYLSIRSQRLPLHGASESQLHAQPSSNSLSVHTPSLHRSGSIASKAPSMENRPIAAELRSSSVGGRWNTKNKSRPRPYHSSTLGSSSRTSFDEPSVWSPSASSTWSKSHYAKTLPSMSSDSLASKFTSGDQGFQQSIGFANALSHAIIREEANNAEDDLSIDDSRANVPLLEDESLELEGAPWAKEGIVHHKHHLETTDKKAKDRNWVECFVVVEKGWMRLFSFNSKAASRSQRNKPLKGGVVGGGNWTDNAEALGSFMLRQTIANALPPPGYSKSRPYVFALSLPTGAVHLFQVGTPEIAQEFVSTANYWSARLSKEPLMGGVSNIEYGWSDNIIAAAEVAEALTNVSAMTRASTTPTPSGHVNSAGSSTSTIVGHIRNRSKSYSASQHSRTYSGRPSFQESVRSSIDLQGQARPKLPGDRIVLGDWTPPQQSMVASQLLEREQFEGLKAYVRDVEEELAKHNELRAALIKAFSPRHPNAMKALANWERKSSYLLREIVKFRTYIDSLSAARGANERVKAQREERVEETKRLKAEAAAAATAGTAPSEIASDADGHSSIHQLNASSASGYDEGVSPLS